MEKLNNCPVCNNESLNDYSKIKDYFFSGEEFTIQQCKQCGFKFVNPRPDKNLIKNYYHSEEYISHSDTKHGLINKLYHIFRNYNLAKKYNIVTSYNPKGNILDIGCATGAFLKFCANKGWNVTGVEPEEKARDFARNANKINVKSEEELFNFKSEEFDVITLWHVLEHISTLNEYLNEIFRTLKKDGTLFIALPNHLSYDAAKYGNFWAAWDVPRHLYHFTQYSMSELSKKHGFIVSEIIPMKLDSYYVSLLSEKYKNGKTGYVSAFISGFKSNFFAKRNNLNYSSLIFVLKKD